MATAKAELILNPDHQQIAIDSGASANIQGTLVDLTKTAISSVLTLTLTLFDEATSTIINSRNADDVSGDFNAGAIAIELDPLDNIIVDNTLAANAIEYHIARIAWTWNDGDGTRYGTKEVRIAVRKLATPTT